MQKVWHFRLTDTETGEFRNVSVAADSKEEAEQVIYRQEAKKVVYQASETELAELLVREKVSQGKQLSSSEKDIFEDLLKRGEAGFGGRAKGQLFAHRQERPYKIQKASG